MFTCRCLEVSSKFRGVEGSRGQISTSGSVIFYPLHDIEIFTFAICHIELDFNQSPYDYSAVARNHGLLPYGVTR